MAPDGFHVVGGDDNSLRTQVANLMSIIVARERRITELEAVVVPLEKILKLVYVACIDIDSDDYCVECYRNGIQSADYRGNTLAEALAAVVKAMEDAT